MVVSVWMISAPTHRAGEEEPAAGQRRAADDHGQDRVELDPQAGVVAVGAGDVRADHQPGDAGAQAAEDVREQDQRRASGCRPAGWPRRCRRPTRCSMPSAVRRVTQRRSARRADRDEDARTAGSASSRRRSACTGSLLIVMIWPSVISWAMPRPATIRISVAMIGWMPITATSTPFHSPSAMRQRRARPRPRAARRRRCSGRRGWLMQQARERAADRHHRADRQVDAAGGDDQRHAQRDQHQRRAEAQDVDQRCRRGARPASRSRRTTAVKKTLASSSDEQRQPAARTGGAWSCAGSARRSCRTSAVQSSASSSLAQLGDQPAVAQHGDLVAEPQHLLQLGAR